MPSSTDTHGSRQPLAGLEAVVVLALVGLLAAATVLLAALTLGWWP